MPTDTPATAERATRGSRQSRNEGQWALGQREPLNPNEQMKADDNPLNVRERIETVYAQGGFASITPDDLRGRMRWYGCTPNAKRGSTADAPPRYPRTNSTPSSS